MFAFGVTNAEYVEAAKKVLDLIEKNPTNLMVFPNLHIWVGSPDELRYWLGTGNFGKPKVAQTYVSIESLDIKGFCLLMARETMFVEQEPILREEFALLKKKEGYAEQDEFEKEFSAKAGHEGLD